MEFEGVFPEDIFLLETGGNTERERWVPEKEGRECQREGFLDHTEFMVRARAACSFITSSPF